MGYFGAIIKWGGKAVKGLFGAGKVASTSRALVPYAGKAAAGATFGSKAVKYGKYAMGGLLVADAASSLGSLAGGAGESIMSTAGYGIQGGAYNQMFGGGYPVMDGNGFLPVMGDFGMNPAMMGFDNMDMMNNFGMNPNQFGGAGVAKQGGLMGMVMQLLGFILNLFSGLFR